MLAAWPTSVRGRGLAGCRSVRVSLGEVSQKHRLQDRVPCVRWVDRRVEHRHQVQHVLLDLAARRPPRSKKSSSLTSKPIPAGESWGPRSPGGCGPDANAASPCILCTSTGLNGLRRRLVREGPAHREASVHIEALEGRQLFSGGAARFVALLSGAN